MAVVPVVRGLYLCEQVTVHPSMNLTLHNCFRAFRVSGLPGRSGPFVVVAYLANGQDEVTAALRVRRLDTLDEVYRGETRFRFADRLAEVRFIYRVSRCTFPTAGAYEASLWVDDELLAQTPFSVYPREEA